MSYTGNNANAQPGCIGLGNPQAQYPYQYQSTYGPMTGNITVPSVSPLTTKVPQIYHQEVELSARLDSQEKLLSILEEKLQPVMGMYPPQEAVPSPGPTLASCPLAARLQGMALRISSLNSSIQSLIDRVEV